MSLTMQWNRLQLEADELADKIVELHDLNGGVTFNVQEEKPVQEGFAVATEVSQRFRGKSLSTYRVRNFIIDHLTELVHIPHINVGTWYDGENSYLELSMVLNDEKYALEQAKSTGQRAIFDLGAKKEIRL
jgi:hypothetical protein